MISKRSALICLALTACGQAPSDRESSQFETSKRDVSSEEVAAAPGINVTAAPGVAFNYRYAFRLPAGRIAKAQEAHAAACEKLGIARCRITGMRYSLTRNDSIDAMLAFKLDPTLARAFGRQGIAVIEAAEGMLANAEITGTDAGAEIAKTSADRSEIADERARIDRELAQTGSSASARTELLRQRAELDQQIRAATTAVADQRETLASTPMTFDYESGAAIRGFDGQSPITDALDTAIGSAQMTLAVLLSGIAVLGPPALLLGLLYLIWLRIRRRFPKRSVAAPSEPS